MGKGAHDDAAFRLQGRRAVPIAEPGKEELSRQGAKLAKVFRCDIRVGRFTRRVIWMLNRSFCISWRAWRLGVKHSRIWAEGRGVAGPAYAFGGCAWKDGHAALCPSYGEPAFDVVSWLRRGNAVLAAEASRMRIRRRGVEREQVLCTVMAASAPGIRARSGSAPAHGILTLF